MSLRPPHRPFSALVALGVLLPVAACGEPSEETPNEANSTVFNNAAAETPCIEKLTQEECHDQLEVTHCRWHGALEWTWDGEMCQYQHRGICILGKGNSPGLWLTVWRPEEDGTPQVIQFGGIPQFEDNTWTQCDQSEDPPLACACEDPELL